MDFDIRCGEFNDSRIISLPDELRRELGLLPGQFLEIKTDKVKLILEVATSIIPRQECALVSNSIYEQIQGQHLEYKILEVTLGCDPEFFILWKQQRITATMYLPFAGQIGSDGELGELRPMYAKHENVVVSNLSNLICQIPGKLKKLRLSNNLPEDGKDFSYEAYSFFMNIPAGFHIHLGLPPEILNTRKDFYRITMNHLVQCLDWYLSVPCIPIEENHGRRLGKSQYGKPGDYRPSNVTLEYRTPGAFFLRSPQLATSLLGTALAVVEVLVSRVKEESKNFANLHTLTKKDLNDIMPVPEKDKLLTTLMHKNISVAQRELPGIYKQLQRLPNYNKHQTAIDSLFRAGECRPRVGPNLLTNWKEKS